MSVAKLIWMVPLLALWLSSASGLTNSTECASKKCGENAECKLVGDVSTCFCPAGYTGDPQTSCTKGECTLSNECDDHLACIRMKCTDPCFGTCGTNAQCKASKHIPVCTCPDKYEGDPFVNCKIIARLTNTTECASKKCGENAECKQEGDVSTCFCLAGYTGDPQTSCTKKECERHSDCENKFACINSKCQDPCNGTCGTNAKCDVINHSPICSCPKKYTGDPFAVCNIINDEPTTEAQTKS